MPEIEISSFYLLNHKHLSWENKKNKLINMHVMKFWSLHRTTWLINTCKITLKVLHVYLHEDDIANKKGIKACYFIQNKMTRNLNFW